MKTWKIAPEIFVVEEPVVDSVDKPATVEVVTFRVLDAFGSPEVMALGRYYLRLRVTRLPQVEMVPRPISPAGMGTSDLLQIPTVEG